MLKEFKFFALKFTLRFFVLVIIMGNGFSVKSQTYHIEDNDSIFYSNQKEIDKNAEIDKYAKRVPLFVGLSYKKLSNHLTKPYTTDEDKVRSITYWMTQHIKYNFRKSNRAKRKLQKPNKTLFKRKGICGDYALLFKELCQHSGVSTEIINGYSKGFYYEPRDTFIRADHSWNGVLINNEWKLMDVLWMGGYAKSKKQYFRKFLHKVFNVNYRIKFKYVKHIDEGYYLANPKELVKTHLPLNTWWQTLKNSVSIELFQSDSMDTFLAQSDTNSGYNFNSKIWQDRNAKKPDKFLDNGNEAHLFNPRNNRVLAHSYYSYGCYLGNEIYNSSISNEDKIEMYDNVVDSLKKGKTINKLYKKDNKSERDWRRVKNKLMRNKLFERNNSHIKADRKIMNDNISMKNKANAMRRKIKAHSKVLTKEQNNLGRYMLSNIKVKRDSSKIKKALISYNDSLIRLYFDSITFNYNRNLFLLQDTLIDINENIFRIRNSLYNALGLSSGNIKMSKTLRNVFVYDWYKEKPIDDIELLVIDFIQEKDSIHIELFKNYYRKIELCKEVITNNKKSSKYFKKILSLLKKNKKNNVYNIKVEEEFEYYKERWDTYNSCLDVLEFTDMKDVKYQCVNNKFAVIEELKLLKKEKKAESKRYSNWSRYYYLTRIKWNKEAQLSDKYCNSCIQKVREYKKEAKEEIKKLEEEQRKKEKN